MELQKSFGARESRGVCGGHPDGGRLVSRRSRHGRGGHGRSREDFDEFGKEEEVSRFRCGRAERGCRGRQSVRNDHVRLVRPRVTEREGVVAGAVDDDPSLTALMAARSDESEDLDDRQVARD